MGVNLLSNRKNKVFCIGLNKTGTTSIESVFRDFGYKLGNQRAGELLLQDWSRRNFKSIINFAKTADAFQDIPFSLPYTYIFLNQYFKNAKFVLTVRDSPEQWYESLVKFHSKLWSDGITPPNKNDLLSANYIYRGYAYEFTRLVWDTSISDIYNKRKLLDFYISHNNQVKDYFRHAPEKFTIINLSNSQDYFKLCKFLEKPPSNNKFPWKNKTDEIN